MGKHIFTIFVAIVIGFTLLLYLFTYQVRSSEVAMVLRFGKPVERAAADGSGTTVHVEPGFHWRWPWPIDEVRRFDNRLHIKEGKPEETLTKDQHNIIVSLCVGWRIDPENVGVFNKTFGASEKPLEVAWGELDRIIRDRMHVVMGQHELSELVNVDLNRLKYDAIESKAVADAQKNARETFGIEIVLLKIKRLELPESTTQQIYARMKKEREREAETIKSRGKEVAELIRANARSQKDQILALARGQAESIKAEGDKEAAAHYSVLNDYPDLAIYLREIQALETVTKTGATIIVDTSTPPFNLLTQGPPEVRKKAE